MFERLDLAYDQADRASVHQALIEVLGMADGADCPEVWQAVKDAYDPVEQDLDAIARDVADALHPLAEPSRGPAGPTLGR